MHGGVTAANRRRRFFELCRCPTKLQAQDLMRQVMELNTLSLRQVMHRMVMRLEKKYFQMHAHHGHR